MNRREFIWMGAGSAALAVAGCATTTSEDAASQGLSLTSPSLNAAAAGQKAKRGRLLGPTIVDFEFRECKRFKGKGKKCSFFIDDVIWIFRDLAAMKPKSCWDHRFLGHLKEAHEKYGLKVQLNVFYRNDFYYTTDEFCLKDMPDVWKAEFQAAKDWLKFGFHSLQEFPDYPFINAEYKDVKYVWDRTITEVERFAGPGMFALAVVPHWGPVSKDGLRALKDCGAKVVWVSTGDRYEYTGDYSCLPYGHAMRVENNRKPETALYSRGGPNVAIDSSACGYNHLLKEQAEPTRSTYVTCFDRDVGINLKRLSSGAPCLNLWALNKLREGFAPHLGEEYVIYATHEEYYYKDYFSYQSDYCEKTFLAAKIMHDAGFEHIFIEESVD